MLLNYHHGRRRSQVEAKQVGQGRPALEGKIEGLSEMSSQAQAQVAILQSNQVLGRVVQALHLDLKATPKTVLNLTEPNRSFTLNCSDNSTCDGVVAQLPWATFLEISNASTVEGDALGFPFRLSGQQIKALKEFAQRLASGEAP